MLTNRLFPYSVLADEIVSIVVLRKRFVPSFIQAIVSRTISLAEIKKEIRCLTHQQIRFLLEGLSIDQLRVISVGKRDNFQFEETKEKTTRNFVFMPEPPPKS